MKLSQVKDRETPFVDTDKLLIAFKQENNIITQIRVVLKLTGKEQIFKTNGKPLLAFKKVEKFVGKIS